MPLTLSGSSLRALRSGWDEAPASLWKSRVLKFGGLVSCEETNLYNSGAETFMGTIAQDAILEAPPLVYYLKLTPESSWLGTAWA